MAALILAMIAWEFVLLFYATGFYAGWGIIAALLMASIVLPLEGFKEKELKDSKVLLPIKHNVGDTFYIEQKGSKIYYTYVNEKNEEVCTKKRIRGNISICEQEECLTPTIQKFVRKVDRSFWAIGLGIKAKVEYVFCVPKGSVINK